MIRTVAAAERLPSGRSSLNQPEKGGMDGMARAKGSPSPGDARRVRERFEANYREVAE